MIVDTKPKTKTLVIESLVSLAWKQAISIIWVVVKNAMFESTADKIIIATNVIGFDIQILTNYLSLIFRIAKIAPKEDNTWIPTLDNRM